MIFSVFVILFQCFLTCLRVDCQELSFQRGEVENYFDSNLNAQIQRGDVEKSLRLRFEEKDPSKYSSPVVVNSKKDLKLFCKISNDYKSVMNLNPNLCTHLIYSYLKIDYNAKDVAATNANLTHQVEVTYSRLLRSTFSLRFLATIEIDLSHVKEHDISWLNDVLLNFLIDKELNGINIYVINASLNDYEEKILEKLIRFLRIGVNSLHNNLLTIEVNDLIQLPLSEKFISENIDYILLRTDIFLTNYDNVLFLPKLILTFNLDAGIGLPFNQVCLENQLVETDNDYLKYRLSNGAIVKYYNLAQIAKKAKFAQMKKLAGICLNSVDMDDYSGKCLKHKWPYLTTVYDQLKSHEEPETESEYCNFDGKIAHFHNCYNYYECKDGLKIQKKCNYGRMFNSETGQCDWSMNIWKCYENRAKEKNSSKSIGDVSADSNGQYKLLCYITNWSFTRKKNPFAPEYLDQDLCTYNVYAYAYLDYKNPVLKESRPNTDLELGYYKRATSLRKPTLLAVGGWTDSQPTSNNISKYSELMNNERNRKQFIENSIDYLKKHNFTGIVFEWFYPVCWNGQCTQENKRDRKNFASFLGEMASQFRKQQPSLVLGVTISGYKEIINGAYDLEQISNHVDFLNVLTIDYHGNWENITNHPTSIYKQPQDIYEEFNINYIIEHLIKKGVPRSKILMTMSFYGYSYHLKDPNMNKFGSPVEDVGETSLITLQKGVMSYGEICEAIKNKKLKLYSKKSEIEVLPYAYNKKLWVAFDNVDSIREKANYLKQMNLAGASVWSVDLDDFQNSCCQQPFPLLRLLSSQLSVSRKIVNEIGVSCEGRIKETVTPLPPKSTTGYYTVYLNFSSTEMNYNQDWNSQTTKPSHFHDHSTSKTTKIVLPATTILTPTVISMEGKRCKRNKPYLAHENNCAKYYQCLNNVYISRECGKALYWNSKHNICDHKNNVDCNLNTENEVHENSETKYDKFCKKSEKIIHPFGCHGYLVCFDNRAHISKCPKGKVFSPKDCSCIQSTYCLVDSKPSFEIGVTTTTTKTTEQQATKTTTLKPEYSTKLNVIEDTEFQNEYKIVCYFTNWATYRKPPMNFEPEDIDYTKCTHTVYAFATLSNVTYTIQSHDIQKDIEERFYDRVVNNKRPNTFVLLGLGGWTDSEGNKYSVLIHDEKKRETFIKDTVQFLKRYKFDGLDLDWEYPKCWQADCDKGPESDKYKFVEFVQELRKEFDNHGFLLSSAFSPSLYVLKQAYDIKKLSKYLDWIGIMNYDYHGIWEKRTGHNAPLYPRNDDYVKTLNVHSTITYFLDQHIDSRKLIMGIPFYAKSFWLNSKYNHGVNAGASRGGLAREYTNATGTMAFYEVCAELESKKWTVVKDEKLRNGPYAYNDQEWISFEDQEIIVKKMNYMKKQKLGGTMIWALDFDDFKNFCGYGKNPLLTTIFNTINNVHYPDSPPIIDNNIYDKPTPAITSSVAPTTVKPYKNEKFKVVCYFTNWAFYRSGIGKFTPSHIDPELCTHIVYAFAVLGTESNEIRIHDSWTDIDNNFYRQVTEMKKHGIKVLIGLGGWNDSAGNKYSVLVNDKKKTAKLNLSILKFIKKYNFDGIDLDWEYPKCWQVDCTKGPDSDKLAFSEWIIDLHELLHSRGYLISAAVSPAKKVIDQGYDVPVLSKYLDWIAVMCYDYHGSWDKKTGHVAPLKAMPGYDPTFNAEFSINYWIEKGADPRKLVMGMPTYGRSFKLKSEQQNSFLATTENDYNTGEYTRASGFLSYYEICLNIQNNNWLVKHDERNRSGPYAYKGAKWVGFDNAEMIRLKSNFVKRKNLGGAMIWALDLDDFNNVCKCEPYPLIRTINRVLRSYDKEHESFTCQVQSTALNENDFFTTTPGTTMWSWSQSPSSWSTYYSASSTKPTFVTGSSQTTPMNEYSSASNSCSFDDKFKFHEKNCSKYYVCVHGQWIEQTCPNNLYWNGNTCNWPYEVQCNVLDNNI